MELLTTGFLEESVVNGTNSTEAQPRNKCPKYEFDIFIIFGSYGRHIRCMIHME